MSVNSNLRDAMRYLYLFFVCCICLASASTCRDTAFFKDAGPLVKTTSGSVVGKYVKVFDTDVAAFLGIPYAKPPVGEKRFAPADPVDPWKGVLLANEKPPACMQYSSRDFAWIPKGLKTSEDCLFVNVWAPTRCSCGKTGEKLPVMLWIHAGGYSTGSSAMDVYDGSVLASYGDVVVVTFNYRVGIFGFLNMVTGEVPGNAGFHDQVMAMKWVRDNIENFGGDPNKVTLFGDSVGSISTSLHMVSPLSKDLFHRAILLSGTFFQPLLVDPPQMGHFKLKTFSEIIGCANENLTLEQNPVEVLECLRKKPAEELAKVEDAFVSKFPIFFLPTYGTEALPKSPIQAAKDGEVRQVDVLMGNVKDESTIFLNYILPDTFPMNGTPELIYNQTQTIVPAILQIMTEPSHASVIEYYFRNVSEDNSEDVVEAISRLFADYVFNCPTLFLAEKLQQARVYWNTHHSQREAKAEWMGLSHFYDVAYVFGQPVLDSVHFTPEDGRFSGDLMQKIVNFARTGNPLSEDSKESWPVFSPSEPLVHELNARSRRNFAFPRSEACEFWRPYFK